MRNKDLDDLLSMAAAQRPTADPALLDRVLADAVAVRPHRPLAGSAPVRSGTLLMRLAQAFGGGAALAGMTAALLLGLVLGYVSPGTFDHLTGNPTEAVDLFPDTDFLTTEG